MDESLRELFENGGLLRAVDDTPNSIDLTKTLAATAGVEGVAETKWSTSMRELIGDPDLLLFVVVDGLGMNLMERLPESSFLRSHMACELRAITPSTTACAFTAFATGFYPFESGITGWFTYLPEHRLTATILPFLERYSETPLQDYGISVDSVFPREVLTPRMGHRPLSILPSEICHSVAARHLRGHTEAIEYSSIAEALEHTISAVTEARPKSYLFLYLPHVDTLSHEKGPTHPEVFKLVRLIDEQLDRLATSLGSDARMVITADHGQITVPLHKQHLLADGDPLLETLQHPPTAEGRFPIFHVSPDRREEFLEIFRERFSQSFSLLALEEAEEAGLFGPGEIGANLRARFGDYVGVAKEVAIIGYLNSNEPEGKVTIGRHGGLSPDEMRVPLIVV